MVISRTIQTSSPRLEKQLAETTTVVRKENSPNIAGPNWRETTQANKKTNSAFEALPAKIKIEFFITIGGVGELEINWLAKDNSKHNKPVNTIPSTKYHCEG
ncbi:MAG: hypothetical protein F3742_12170 [Nitrospinae bacterium]|nr:hypothetical protein [Nitrospinota bacterium]